MCRRGLTEAEARLPNLAFSAGAALSASIFCCSSAFTFSWHPVCSEVSAFSWHFADALWRRSRHGATTGLPGPLQWLHPAHLRLRDEELCRDATERDGDQAHPTGRHSGGEAA